MSRRCCRAVAPHCSGAAEAPEGCRQGGLTHSTDHCTKLCCVFCRCPAPLDRCLFIWELLLLLHAQGGFFHTCALLLQVCIWSMTVTVCLITSFLLLSLLSHSCLCLQDRLWIPLLFFVHLSSGQHLTDEEQETCVYERVCICIYLCVLNVPLNIKGFCILLKMPFQVLTFGQAYQISLQLEMPDSPTNQEQGMFMIRAACFSRDGGQVASSSRHVSFIKCCSSYVYIQSDNASSFRKLHWLTALLCVSQASKQLSASSSRFVSTSLTHNNLLITQPGQSQIRAAYACCRALLQQKVILVFRWLTGWTCQLKTDTNTWSQ